MSTYIPTLIAVVMIFMAIFQGAPMLDKKLKAERITYEEESLALETARKSEAASALKAVEDKKKNEIYTEFNLKWARQTESYSRAEDAQRMIVSEAQKAGLKVGKSTLIGAEDYNTLEGKVRASQFEINVEGTHAQIGQWMARCEANLKTLRPVIAIWRPYATVVSATIAFQLLDDQTLMDSSLRGIETTVAPTE